jgi:lysine 2,3-aminomutase
MAEEWVEQMQNQVNTLEKLEEYINVTDDERAAIQTLNTRCSARSGCRSFRRRRKR